MDERLVRTVLNKDSKRELSVTEEAATLVIHQDLRVFDRFSDEDVEAFLHDEDRIEAYLHAKLVWEELAYLDKETPAGETIVTPFKPRLPIKQIMAIAATMALAIVSLAAWFNQPDVYSTAIGEQKTIQLSDGTNIELNTGSEIKVAYNKKRRLVVLESGEAMFGVSHDIDRPFLVQVGDKLVRAVGTSFIIRKTKDDAVQVTLLSGIVDVEDITSGTTQPITLAPGERYSYTEDAANNTSVSSATAGELQQLAIDRPELQKLTAWRRGLVILDGLTVSEAVQEMNRYANGKKILLNSPELESKALKGVAHINNVEGFAQAIAEAYGLRVVESDTSIVLK